MEVVADFKWKIRPPAQLHTRGELVVENTNRRNRRQSFTTDSDCFGSRGGAADAEMELVRVAPQGSRVLSIAERVN
jgi:hypothetical protein